STALRNPACRGRAPPEVARWCSCPARCSGRCRWLGCSSGSPSAGPPGRSDPVVHAVRHGGGRRYGGLAGPVRVVRDRTGQAERAAPVGPGALVGRTALARLLHQVAEALLGGGRLGDLGVDPEALDLVPALDQAVPELVEPAPQDL